MESSVKKCSPKYAVAMLLPATLLNYDERTKPHSSLHNMQKVNAISLEFQNRDMFNLLDPPTAELID
jgi:hypothetical protein